MFKILDYCDEYRDRNPTEFVEPMVIANTIPPERKRRLSHSGVPFREIPEIEFSGGLLPKIDNPDGSSRSLHKAESQRVIRLADSSTREPGGLSLEEAGYSPGEIDDLQKAIHSFEQVVLPLKKEREAAAEKLLQRSKGRYTIEVLDRAFDLVDKGPIGPVVGAWFGQTLVKPNRDKLYRCSMTELTMLIDELRETGDLGSLAAWRRADKHNRGMKTGAATLLMYLHSPESYNIWLPKTHAGLSRLCRLGTPSPKDPMSPDECRSSYKTFNENAIAVREKNGFAPQTMDWFLFAVDEIRENPANRNLRALIEGRVR
jgi:hypothetical protein